MSSEIERSVKQFRRLLIERDAESRAAIRRSFRTAIDGLQSDLTATTNRITELRAEGKPVRTYRFLQEQRIRQLIARAEIEFQQFSDRVDLELMRAQRDALDRAQRDARQLIVDGFGPPPPGAALPVHMLPTEALTQLTASMQPGAPVHRLLKEFAGTAARAVQDELKRGMSAGLSPYQIGRLITNRLGVEHSVRAQRIVRTELMRSYRESMRATLEQNKHLVRGWVWFSGMNARTCAICIALHGRKFETDVKMATHPNCFPAGTLVSGPPVIGSTTRWYDGDLVDIRLSSGTFLSVTQNHPILTSKGWIAAGALNKSSEVIRCLDTERMLAAVNPDNQNGPALIEDIAVTFGGSALVAAVGVPTAAKDFHGDGAGSHISVVRTNRLLRRALNPAIRQPSLQKQFSRRRVGLTQLASLSAFAFFIERLNSPASGVLGGNDHAFSFFWRHIRNSNRHTFRSTTWLDSGFNDTEPNQCSRHTKRFSDRFFRFTRKVTRHDFSVVFFPSAIFQYCRQFLSSCFMPCIGTNRQRCTSAFLGITNMNVILLKKSFECRRRYPIFMGKRRKRFSDFIAPDGIRQPFGVRVGWPSRTGPQLNTAINQDTFQSTEIGPEHAHQVTQRLAGLITTDNIVCIERRAFSGHVYNLQTTEGWYSAAGIITHNCRCVLMPDTKSWKDLGYDVPDTRAAVQSGPDQFAGWTPEQQRNVLGNAAHAAYANGDVELSDFIGITRSETWGTGRRRVSLATAKQRSKRAA